MLNINIYPQTPIKTKLGYWIIKSLQPRKLMDRFGFTLSSRTTNSWVKVVFKPSTDITTGSYNYNIVRTSAIKEIHLTSIMSSSPKKPHIIDPNDPALFKDGEFTRKDSQFRNFITKDGPYLPEPNRYHLYISLACPWAHRTLIVRKLKGLDKIIGLSVVHYLMGINGWSFENENNDKDVIPDTVNNCKYLRELYFLSNPKYNGRFTVPVLFDTKTKTIVNNESSEILRMFNTEFNELATTNSSLDLYPPSLQSKIDELNQIIYDGINNGVYKAGFATAQRHHEESAKMVYNTLMKVESILAENKFICGKVLTETDIRLFTSIIRFDPVYYVHFKCNLVAVRELPNLLRWLKMIYEMDGIKETVNMDHIKKHYYMSHLNINPFGVVPLYNGPIG